jgi:IclR family transcriptional regulator, pca regulon regulatory protein
MANQGSSGVESYRTILPCVRYRMRRSLGRECLAYGRKHEAGFYCGRCRRVCRLRRRIVCSRVVQRQAPVSPAKDKSKKFPTQPRSGRISPTPDPRMSRSFEYGAAILEAFSHEHLALGIAELAEFVGITRSTTHRYAATLVALGYLEQDPKRKYRLSLAATGPGHTAIGSMRRQVPARVALEELRDKTGHTVSMGVLDSTRVIYVHRLFGHHRGQYEIDMDLGVGATVPVYCTALGKVLLASLSDDERLEIIAGLQLIPHGPNSILAKSDIAAELDRLNVRDAVVSDEELTAGARSIAALIPRPAGEYALAIDITVPSWAYTVNRLRKKLGPPLRRTVRLISRE